VNRTKKKSPVFTDTKSCENAILNEEISITISHFVVVAIRVADSVGERKIAFCDFSTFSFRPE
jgi:hypothetical protein